MDLPTPYARQDDEEPTPSAMKSRIELRDKWRGRWTKLAINAPSRLLRYSLSVTLLVIIVLSSTTLDQTLLDASRFVWALSVISFIPPSIAATYARMTAKDRLELRRKGFSLRESYVGVERILNQLDENKLTERTRLSAAIVGLILSSTMASNTLQTDLSLTLLGVTALMAVVVLLATVSVERQKTMEMGKTPLLRLHNPSLFDTIADPLLVDLVYAHLDPETSSKWNDWMETITLNVRRNQKSEHAVETVLRSIYFTMTDKMDFDERRRICTQVLNMPAVERLESQDEFFNFEELESFLLHVVERKPGIFRLLSRTIQRAGRLRATEDWTLDADLPPRATHGESDLFVLASPGKSSAAPFEIDIITVEGEPETQVIRLPPIDRVERPGRAEGSEDWQIFNSVIDRSHVLWIGMAWNKSGHEGRSVQVNLLSDNSTTVKSQVLWTIMEDGDGILLSTVRKSLREVYSMITRSIIR